MHSYTVKRETSSTDKIIEKIIPGGEIIFSKFTRNELTQQVFFKDFTCKEPVNVILRFLDELCF